MNAEQKEAHLGRFMVWGYERMSQYKTGVFMDPLALPEVAKDFMAGKLVILRCRSVCNGGVVEKHAAIFVRENPVDESGVNL